MADDTELVEADDEDIEGAVAELGGSEGAESPDELGHESGPDGYDDVADEVLSESEAEGQDGQPRGPDGKFIAFLGRNGYIMLLDAKSKHWVRSRNKNS